MGAPEDLDFETWESTNLTGLGLMDAEKLNHAVGRGFISGTR